ncbi:MAG: 1-deoxy-D-xylulose-5-phosphate reductoisomerase [Acutalibacteraceae bacterium]
MKSINLLGSTGSIGMQTLDVARAHSYKIKSLTAYSNVDIIENQIREFKPEYAALVDEKAAADLKVRVADLDVKVLSGIEGVSFCGAEADGEITLNSVVGMAGLKPTLDAVNAGKTIALANKETLVAGGCLVTDAAKKNNVSIIPVDSEHSAIFQCLLGAPANNALKRIILTASGGPFFGKTKEELKNVTLKDALKHPNWSMGQKITVDSATMFNKGLELIEAVWLFGVSPDMIDIVVHRESIVHSLIEYADNSVIAQLGHPDMRLPIQFAITYPERYESPEKQLDLWEIGNLSFYKPDYENFPCMNICRDAITKGGLYPAAVNCANEEANLLFRQGKISFNSIPELISNASEYTPDIQSYTLDDVLNVNDLMREKVRELSDT